MRREGAFGAGRRAWSRKATTACLGFPAEARAVDQARIARGGLADPETEAPGGRFPGRRSGHRGTRPVLSAFQTRGRRGRVAPGLPFDSSAPRPRSGHPERRRGVKTAAYECVTRVSDCPLAPPAPRLTPYATRLTPYATRLTYFIWHLPLQSPRAPDHS